MITIEKLTKYYGKNRAVNNISFTINDNEILGFLGPNGAGKSTTMNMIAGYLPMTAGKVTICGDDITLSPTKAKQNIGYLPEIPPVYPDMKVSEYLSFCAGLKRIPRSQRKSEMKRVMELLKITDMKNRLIKNLSKGYKQRVGFAQALLGNPKFLILDEPTVGLDPNQVAEVRQIIKDLRKEHSVIFSSHILSEVSAVCDRVVIINKGDIKAIDTIENLEKSLSDRMYLVATIKGSEDKIMKSLGTVDGISDISDVKEIERNTFRMKISMSGDSEKVRNKIMAAIMLDQLQIVEIYTEKPDLEEIFLNYVNKDTSGFRSSVQDLFDELSDEINTSDAEAENETPSEEKEEE